MENMKMKKEIRFRAYDTLTKKMSPDFVLFGEFTLLGAVHAWQHEEAILAGLKWDAYANHDSLGRLNDLEIMQYTGLKDKNGKEIYEGDIIVLPAGQRCEIKYIDTMFVAIAIDPPINYPKSYNYWKGSVDVIGNIYDGR